MTAALIMVDVQHDFINGSLGGCGRDRIIDPLDRLAGYADVVVSSQDWHPADHCSFSDAPTFEDGSWPVHCVQGTHGADLHPMLAWMTNEFVFKGADSTREAYSAFHGFNRAGRSLAAILAERAVDEVWVGGLVVEKCVSATALDALRLGYPTKLVLDCCAGLDALSTAATLEGLRASGVALTRSAALRDRVSA